MDEYELMQPLKLAKLLHKKASHATLVKMWDLTTLWASMPGWEDATRALDTVRRFSNPPL